MRLGGSVDIAAFAPERQSCPRPAARLLLLRSGSLGLAAALATE
jgi:hypothetical protein